MTRLPPLNALRAFEAAARHLSMKAAAAELNVTPAAVSQLVRVLEEHVGVRLFRRTNRALMLTEAGQLYWPPLRNAFRQIGDASRRIAAVSTQSVLTVSVPPAVAASWLVPRMGRFRARHPAIDVRVVTSRALADFAADGVDAAIRYGLGRYKGLHSDRLLAVEMIAVCAPALLAERGAAAPSDAEALLELPLLHDGAREEWPLWFQAQGVSVVTPAALAGASFDDQVLLIRAAVAGQGVALVMEALARPELERGDLVHAFDGTWPRESAYWFVCPQEVLGQPKVARFREWLLAEAAGGS